MEYRLLALICTLGVLSIQGQSCQDLSSGACSIGGINQGGFISCSSLIDCNAAIDLTPGNDPRSLCNATGLLDSATCLGSGFAAVCCGNVGTVAPTLLPTIAPTKNPTTSPTISPTKNPTMSPTVSPTKNPTTTPTTTPTKNPTGSPVVVPPTGFFENETNLIAVAGGGGGGLLLLVAAVVLLRMRRGGSSGDDNQVAPTTGTGGKKMKLDEKSDIFDWEKHIDKKSGEVYFFNPKTGESRWDPPEVSA